MKVRLLKKIRRKYRICETVNNQFVIKRKFLWFWRLWSWDCGESFGTYHFDTCEEAQRFIVSHYAPLYRVRQNKCRAVV